MRVKRTVKTRRRRAAATALIRGEDLKRTGYSSLLVSGPHLDLVADRCIISTTFFENLNVLAEFDLLFGIVLI